jgi:hypothetical protein
MKPSVKTKAGMGVGLWNQSESTLYLFEIAVNLLISLRNDLI